jgi:hypothetical protein
METLAKRCKPDNLLNITNKRGIRRVKEMQTAIVKFDNGYTIKTNINGTDDEVKAYFAVGTVVNLGDGCGGDLLARVVSCEVV